MVSMVVYALELLMTIEKQVFSFCDIHLSTKIRQLTYANQQNLLFGGGGNPPYWKRRIQRIGYRMKQSQ